jgi:general secretion pathway protein K
MKKNKFNGNQRSSILIIALWSVSLLTTLAVILGFEVRQQLVLVKRLEERESSRLVAEAGIIKASAILLPDPEEKFQSLNQKWSNNPESFKDVVLGNARFSLSFETDSGQIRFGLVDEESKVNINKANSRVISRLLNLVGLEEVEAQGLAESIVDWRDEDSALSGPGGAEDSYYRMLPLSYEAKDAEFETIDELLLIKGVSENNFPKIRKYITIYGNGQINVNTAGKLVLMALGLSENAAERIISYRKGKDALEATADDNAFENVSDIAVMVNEGGNLSQAEQAQINNLVSEGLVSVKSDNFTAKTRAFSGSSKFSREVTAVINRKGKILYWNET